MPGELFSPQALVWLGSFALLLPRFTPTAFPGPAWQAVTDPLWTIPAEVSFYLAIPALMWVSKRVGVLSTAAGIVVVSMAARLLVSASGGVAEAILHHVFLELGPYFAAGMLLTRYGSRIPLRWWVAVPAAVIQSALLAFGRLEPFVSVYGPLKPLLLALPLAYVLLYVGVRLGPALHKLTSRVGDLSFGVYIWHMAVAAVFVTLGFSGTPTAALSVIAVSLGLAACSWYFVERPCLALKRHSLRPVESRRLGLLGASRRSSPH